MTTFGSFSDRWTLSNGVQIPCLGFGTYRHMVSTEISVEMNKYAAQSGYRLFDTASVYRNERSIGDALRQSGVPREDFFVVSKVWDQDQGYDSTLAVIEESLTDLGFDYIDLYLIHWPVAAGHEDDWQQMNLETWRAMEKCYRDGKLRAIGVSNFLEHHLQPLMAAAEIPVMANEIEMNIGFCQYDIRRFCRAHGIRTIAYSPLAGIGKEFAELSEICKKYNKTQAQIILRWIYQHDTIAIPSSYDCGRMVENTAIFDFRLNSEEMAVLDSIEDPGRRHNNPDARLTQVDRHTRPKI